MKKAKYTKTVVLKAIKASCGSINYIAKKLGCDWHTAKKYIYKWTETKQAWQDEKEVTLDMAESLIYKALQEGSIPVAQWLLTRKGAGRGYSDKQEVDIEEKSITIIRRKK